MWSFCAEGGEKRPLRLKSLIESLLSDIWFGFYWTFMPFCFPAKVEAPLLSLSLQVELLYNSTVY
jgi:hypothetical protein